MSPLAPVVVRPATREDIDAFSGITEGMPTTKAFVAELDGRIIALWGIALTHGRWFAFCDLTEEARPYKMTMMRAGKRLIAEARRVGIKYIYAEASPVETGAVAWMHSLGFVLDPRSEHFYRWSANDHA